MRRNAELLDPRSGYAPGAAHVNRFAAGLPPQSVAEGLRHARLERTFPHVVPATHVDVLMRLMRLAEPKP
jgi:hypothetical protein